MVSFISIHKSGVHFWELGLGLPAAADGVHARCQSRILPECSLDRLKDHDPLETWLGGHVRVEGSYQECQDY